MYSQQTVSGALKRSLPSTQPITRSPGVPSPANMASEYQGRVGALQQSRPVEQPVPITRTSPGFVSPPGGYRPNYPITQQPIRTSPGFTSPIPSGGQSGGNMTGQQTQVSYEQWRQSQPAMPSVMVPDPRGGGGQVDYTYAEYLKATGQGGQSGSIGSKQVPGLNELRQAIALAVSRQSQ